MEALTLYIEFYKKYSLKLSNLVIVSHGNTEDWRRDKKFDYGAILGNTTLTSRRLNIKTNEGKLMGRVAKSMDKGGSILFTACYAGWTHEAMRKLMDDSHVDMSVSIYMNKDFSEAFGTGGYLAETKDGKEVTRYRSYRIKLDEWLTTTEQHKNGWVNARTGTSFNNARILRSGKIDTK